MNTHQKLLAESEQQYKLLFDENPFPAWVYDSKTLRFLNVNQSAIDFYGYTRDEFLSMTIKDLRNEEESIKLMKFIEEHGEHPPMHAGLWQHKKKDGSSAHVEITSQHIYFMGVQAVLVVINDSTERINADKKAKYINERYAYVAKATNDAIWDWNLLTNEIYWNDSFYTLFGYKPEKVSDIVSSWSNHIHEEDRERVLKSIRKEINNRDSTLWQDEYRYMKANGDIAYVIDRGYIIYDENKKPVRMIGAMQDITALKDAEQKIKKINIELEKRVTERTLQLEAVNKELESFSYVVSHDLKAPIRTIISYCELMRRSLEKDLKPEDREYMQFMVGSARKMTTLIDALLSFSKTGKKSIQLTEINTNKIIEKIIEEQKKNYPLHHVDVVLHKLPSIIADEVLIDQVFINLISNAFKYSSKKENIFVEIGGEEKEFEYYFYIKDKGAGFDMKYAKNLFQAFSRLHPEEEFEGAGIGLATVKQIIEKHGGKIWAEANINKGASFYFTIAKQISVS
ncbi:MAG: PAS domain S-box protein [Fimbriimonadaceae bacterium]|nr:PAS domain S-box protein [Chitinophagales bacterium]